MDFERIIKELTAILDNLCGRELNNSGREYIKKRIKVYERLRDEARDIKRTA